MDSQDLLRQLVREQVYRLFSEESGEQLEISNFSDITTEKVLDKLILYKDDLVNMSESSFTTFAETPEKIRIITKIEYIKIYVDHSYSENFKFNGHFSPGKTVLLKNGFYEAGILLEMKSNVENVDIEKLNVLMAHELNHAFVYIKQLYDNKSKNNSKTYKLNIVNKITSNDLREFLQEYPAIKEFTKMFYLSLPQEINARVQETAKNLSYSHKDNYNKTIESLRKFNPINDAKEMLNYKLDDINKIDKEILQKFVNNFNLNIKKFSGDSKIKTINNVDKFFKYWTKFIGNGGHRLYRNIMNLVAKKHELDESYVIAMMDPHIHKQILGESFNLYHISL